ncbi:MAG: M6 family metalloprotease domain-containing protein [Anaerolineales bacterium]|nr:M6 family metalloprotease domain-containing protein [Anaerolineales bacterium]
MLTRRVIVCLLLAVLLVGCSPPPAEPAVLPPSTPAPSLVPQPTPTLTSGQPPVDACQRQTFAHLGLGFPRSEHRLPSLGAVQVVVLFADYDDAPAAQSPQDLFAIISPQAEQFFAAQSYGRFTLELQPHFVWLRLSQPSAHYGASLTSYFEHLAFLQEAVDLADAEVDFSQADAVVLLSNPDAYEIIYGPTYTGFLDSGLTADGVIIPNGTTSGRDLIHWGYLWLNHEMGHSLGLPDLYAYDNGEHIFRYNGGYSLMGNIFGHAPELTAYERWILGWLDDEQIYCLPAHDTTQQTLTAIETAGGLKALVVALDESRSLVVEARRALGYDERLEQPGVLVYVVDASIASGYGPLVVLPQDDPLDNERWQATLQRGETLEFEGLIVHVVESGDTYDTVVVQPSP